MVIMNKDNKNNYYLKRYTFTFIIVILLMIVFLLMEKSIPNEKSRRNILKSEKYYHEYFDHQFSNINIIKNKHETVDVTADLYHLSMIYLEDNKHLWKSFIEMNKDDIIDPEQTADDIFPPGIIIKKQNFMTIDKGVRMNIKG